MITFRLRQQNNKSFPELTFRDCSDFSFTDFFILVFCSFWLQSIGTEIIEEREEELTR